jgi:hypothetical protein
VRSYRTFSPSPPVRAVGCLFSVALSVGSFVSRPRVSLLGFNQKRYAASRPVVFGLSSQPFLKPPKSTMIRQFQKGLGDSLPFQNRRYPTLSTLKNQE